MAVTFAISALVWKYGRPLLDTTRYDHMISLIMILASCVLIIYNFEAYTIREFFLPPKLLTASRPAGQVWDSHPVSMWKDAGSTSHIRTPGKRRLLQFVIGLLTTLAFQQGLKPILGDSICAGILRYLIVVFWIIALYPYLSQKLRNSAHHSI